MAEVDVAVSHTVTIRPAVPSDIDWLITQVKAFATFNQTKYFLFGNEEEARAGLLGMMSQHFMRIAERDGVPLGFIAAYWVKHPYNSKINLLAETFWWVDELHRFSSAGARLLHEFVAFAKEHVQWATFSLLVNSPVNESVLLRLGFKKHETAYLLEFE
jgi:hypothetical protein